MSVNGISGAQSYQPVQFNPLTFFQPTNTSSTGSSNSASDGVSANLSDPAKFFSELKQLSQTDPAAFKQITAKIAAQLNTDAQSATDPTQATRLQNLAANFTQASQTGDFSSLFPPSSAGNSGSGSN